MNREWVYLSEDGQLKRGLSPEQLGESFWEKVVEAPKLGWLDEVEVTFRVYRLGLLLSEKALTDEELYGRIHPSSSRPFIWFEGDLLPRIVMKSKWWLQLSCYLGFHRWYWSTLGSRWCCRICIASRPNAPHLNHDPQFTCFGVGAFSGDQSTSDREAGTDESAGGIPVGVP